MQTPVYWRSGGLHCYMVAQERRGSYVLREHSQTSDGRGGSMADENVRTHSWGLSLKEALAAVELWQDEKEADKSWTRLEGSPLKRFPDFRLVAAVMDVSLPAARTVPAIK